MRLLLDEDVPLQFVAPIRHLLSAHDAKHVDELSWESKKDLALLRDAAKAGFGSILTNDSSQLSSPEECKAIKLSGMHHIRFKLNTRRGVEGLAYALAEVVAAIRPIVPELDTETEQRLVLVSELAVRKRHETTNAKTDPLPYWPRARQKQRPRR
jgi:hypothetical protein